MNTKTSNYTEQEHRHRFASWCASRAASVRNKCTFSAKAGQEIIEASELVKVSYGWDKLNFSNQNEFDRWHFEMRESICLVAKEKVTGDCTHGIAAKIINIYLKTIFIVGVHGKLSSDQVKILGFIHPPIDRTILKELTKNNVGGLATEWRKYETTGFSKFKSEEYEAFIYLIKKVTYGNPLWTIEEHFKGYQK